MINGSSSLPLPRSLVSYEPFCILNVLLLLIHYQDVLKGCFSQLCKRNHQENLKRKLLKLWSITITSFNLGVLIAHPALL